LTLNSSRYSSSLPNIESSSSSTFNIPPSFTHQSHIPVQNYGPTTISTLPNGIRVATTAVPGHFASIGAAIESGQRFENDNNQGVCHFLDRMAFKVSKQNFLFIYIFFLLNLF